MTRAEVVRTLKNPEGRKNIGLVAESILRGDGTCTLTWARRNRLTETTPLGWTDPDVEPEAGQTTVIEMYALDDSDNLIGSVLPHGPFYSIDVGSVTSFDYDRETIPPPEGTRTLVFALHAKRDGYWSWTAGAVGITIPDLSISGVPILTAIKDVAYAGFTATAGYGTPPYTYSLVGTWPAGIAINPSTGAVSGAPTEMGSFAGLSVRVTDAASKTADLPSFTVAVSAATFPIVQATNISNESTATTTHTIALPSGIASGDVLLAFVTLGGDGARLIDTPSGWRRLFHVADFSRISSGFYRVADGTEATSITAKTWFSALSSHMSYRISNAGGAPEAVASNSGTTINPDPPSLSPSWGTRNTLWLAFEGHRNASILTSAAPSGYSNILKSFTGAPTNNPQDARCTTALRELAASSEDPGAFTVASPGGNCVAATVAVSPKPALPASGFPQVKSTNRSSTETAATSHTVSLPIGIQSGDLLMAMVTLGGASTTISTPSGWTALFNVAGSNRTSACFHRVADGSEGSSVTVISGAARKSAHQAFRIANYQGNPEAMATDASTINPDPPSLSPSWGTRNTLWLAFEGHRNNAETTGVPTSYTDPHISLTGSGTTDDATCTTARRELNAASENPGTFTNGSVTNHVAATIAIRGA